MSPSLSPIASSSYAPIRRRTSSGSSLLVLRRSNPDALAGNVL